jgi:hypothetical protein
MPQRGLISNHFLFDSELRILLRITQLTLYHLPAFQNITMQFLACIFVFCPLISALAFNAPEATPVAEILKLHPQGWSPQPTEPPQFNKELLKRQSSSSLTLIEGPDGVCGYQFGVAGKFRIYRQLPTLIIF